MGSAAPPVSVLLPVRDGAAHLGEAAASLEAQTFADFEVVAVDDGSTDGTGRVLADWAARDTRVRVVRREASGIVAALEVARELARGRYLARMDADDVSEPERLARQAELLEGDPRIALAGCGVRYFPRRLVRDGGRRYERWINGSRSAEEVARALFVECPVAHPTFFMRADAVAAVGGYRDMGWPEDYDLVLRLWAAGGRIEKCPETLLRWREGPDRLSRSHSRYAPEAFLACKIHHLKASLLADGRDVVVWGAGPVGKAAARALVAAGTGLRAFVEVDPRKIGQTIHDVPVLDADEGLGQAGVLHLAAVGQEGVRTQLRTTLAGGGLEELRDFVAIA